MGDVVAGAVLTASVLQASVLQASVLPASLLGSELFAALAVFVAVNTLIYVVLAASKVLPKVYVRDWLPRRHQRGETRSIHPDGPL